MKHHTFYRERRQATCSELGNQNDHNTHEFFAEHDTQEMSVRKVSEVYREVFV